GVASRDSPADCTSAGWSPKSEGTGSGRFAVVLTGQILSDARRLKGPMGDLGGEYSTKGSVIFVCCLGLGTEVISLPPFLRSRDLKESMADTISGPLGASAPIGRPWIFPHSPQYLFESGFLWPQFQQYIRTSPGAEFNETVERRCRSIPIRQGDTFGVESLRFRLAARSFPA